MTTNKDDKQKQRSNNEGKGGREFNTKRDWREQVDTKTWNKSKSHFRQKHKWWVCLHKSSLYAFQWLFFFFFSFNGVSCLFSCLFWHEKGASRAYKAATVCQSEHMIPWDYLEILDVNTAPQIILWYCDSTPPLIMQRSVRESGLELIKGFEPAWTMTKYGGGKKMDLQHFFFFGPSFRWGTKGWAATLDAVTEL